MGKSNGIKKAIGFLDAIEVKPNEFCDCLVIWAFIAGDFNVISVDWGSLAGPSPFYEIAAKNTKPVGYLAADLITYLVETFESLTYDDFHPIGFSLGGQVVGHLGYHLNGTLARITGLDPAGPLFHTVPPSERLHKMDAKFVDVVHAAGLWIGTDEPVI